MRLEKKQMAIYQQRITAQGEPEAQAVAESATVCIGCINGGIMINCSKCGKKTYENTIAMSFETWDNSDFTTNLSIGDEEQVEVCSDCAIDLLREVSRLFYEKVPTGLQGLIEEAYTNIKEKKNV
jgi:NAD-dependent SIR2 family protein deacetylase